MRHVQFIRSNTFLWASAVAAVFAVFVVALFGFIHWKIDGYLISRSRFVCNALAEEAQTKRLASAYRPVFVCSSNRETLCFETFEGKP
jgi:hypothetical protein